MNSPQFTVFRAYSDLITYFRIRIDQMGIIRSRQNGLITIIRDLLIQYNRLILLMRHTQVAFDIRLESFLVSQLLAIGNL